MLFKHSFKVAASNPLKGSDQKRLLATVCVLLLLTVHPPFFCAFGDTVLVCAPLWCDSLSLSLSVCVCVCENIHMSVPLSFFFFRRYPLLLPRPLPLLLLWRLFVLSLDTPLGPSSFVVNLWYTCVLFMSRLTHFFLLCFSFSFFLPRCPTPAPAAVRPLATYCRLCLCRPTGNSRPYDLPFPPRSMTCTRRWMPPNWTL